MKKYYRDIRTAMRRGMPEAVPETRNMDGRRGFADTSAMRTFHGNIPPGCRPAFPGAMQLD